MKLNLVRRSAPTSSLDLHDTPECATRALLACETLPLRIYEPACGRGAIVRVLRDAGFDVLAADVRRRRGMPADALVRDFLTDPLPRAVRSRALVTNPPFSVDERFVALAVTYFDFCAFLLRFAWYEGGVGNTETSALRRFVLDERPPARIHVFRRRLPMMHREGWTGPVAGSGVPFAWFVWDVRSEKRTEIDRIDWVDVVDGAPRSRKSTPPIRRRT